MPVSEADGKQSLNVDNKKCLCVSLHQKHPAFGPAACLFARWLSCHLLSDHWPPEVSALLVSAVFALPAPLRPPAQPTSAFYRALRLIATTDWSTQMLVLDYNDDMSRE